MTYASETADGYVQRIVASRTPFVGPGWAQTQLLMPSILTWANGHQYELQLSGSRAKGTAITGSTDLDIFISLNPSVSTCNTLEQVYSTLRNRLTADGHVVREQNVSLGLTHVGLQIDVVPGVLHDVLGHDHSLYKRKAETWTKTNIQTHIEHVKASGRTADIRAVKIWRQLWNLDFPSFYLELSVLRALNGRALVDPAANFLAVMQYLVAELTSRSIVDPANTNNCISDDLTIAEKRAIATAAASALQKANWSEIIW